MSLDGALVPIYLAKHKPHCKRAITKIDNIALIILWNSPFYGLPHFVEKLLYQ